MEFQEHVSLKPFNTFGFNVKAKKFITISSVEMMEELIKTSTFQLEKVLILGGGSNILLSGDFDGLVVKNEIKGIKVVDESANDVKIKVGAGFTWHSLVEETLRNNWGGLENLSLIPGTVGAAPMQNIGAYGVEIKEVFEELTAVDRHSGEVKIFSKADCQFGYRESIFKRSLKDQMIICDVTLRLTKHHKLSLEYGAIQSTLSQMGISKPTIQDVSQAVISIRQSKLPDPEEIGNAGSFFKNPIIEKDLFDELKKVWSDLPGYAEGQWKVKVPAGWLIERCGWKGKRVGEVGVHEKQALVLVNFGEGDGSSLLALSHEIQKSVKERFDIDLEREVNLV